MDPQWLSWAKRLAAIAQTGLTYAKDQFDTERYESARRVAAEMMAYGSQTPDVEVFLKMFRADSGYATPKVDVRAAVFRDSKLLLVKEWEDGCWTVPGGWADVGDSPSMAVVREVKEESGYDVKASKLLALLDRNFHGHPPIPYHAYKLFFLCDLLGGESTAGNETQDVGFFGEEEMPPLSLTRVTPAQVSRLFEHLRHPEWPTQFD
jgi:ADP-ribose pyrophosphatase YjhB (NUDIX family)